MNDHSTLTSLFSDIADSIRAKTGSNGLIKADEFPDAIDDISTGIVPSGSISITENGTYDVTEKASAVVNVSGGVTPTVGFVPTAWDSRGRMTSCDLYGSAPNWLFALRTQGTTDMTKYCFGVSFLENVTFKSDALDIIEVGRYAFAYNENLKQVINLDRVCSIDTSAFKNCTSLTEVTLGIWIKTGVGAFQGTVSDTAFSGCTNLTDIYVPWSEGDVPNAPWGATNATIHYDYVPE